MLVGYRATALPLPKAELKLINNVQRDVKLLQQSGFHPNASEFAYKKHITRHDDFLAYGNFWSQLKPFVDEFGLDKIHFMDGTKMATVEAEQEAKYFESFLKVSNELIFEMNEKKGFMCLKKPFEFCLSDAKGRKSTINYKVQKKKLRNCPNKDIWRKY